MTAATHAPARRKAATTYAVSYLRFSSKAQAKKDSYRRQIEATEKYCRDNGLVLNQHFEDLGVSGWDKSNLDDTAALGRFLKLVKDGQIPKGTVLVCENLDRLTRTNILDALNLFISIIKQGIDIVTTMDGKRYSLESIKANPMELMISITYLTRGNNESETKSQRVKESWVRRHSQIKKNEFAKVRCPSWLTHDGKQYLLIKEHAKTVKLIFQLYVSGYGVYSLVNELNRRNVKPFTKTGRWTAVFLHELLQNPAVIGTYSLVDPPQKNYYPAAIDEDLFYKALAQRQSNQNHRGKTGQNKEINIFGGLCKCHRCGGSMVKHSSKSKKGTEYVGLTCSNAKIGECKYEFTNWNKFQESFFFVFYSEHFEPFLQDSTAERKEDRTAALEGKLIEASNNVARVARILAKTDSDSLEGQLVLLEAEKANLEKELEAERIRVKAETNKTAAYFDLVKNFEKRIKQTDFRLSLRNFMRSAIQKIVCRADSYDVHFTSSSDLMTIDFLPEGYQMSVNGTWHQRILDFN